MREILCLSIILTGASISHTRPQQSVGDMTRGHINLKDIEQWRDLLAEGKMREMVDKIQRLLGLNRAVQVRTQWGGPEAQGLVPSNAVRNVLKWNAYHGNKSNLNLILDTRMSRGRGKSDVIDRVVGLSYQLRY